MKSAALLSMTLGLFGLASSAFGSTAHTCLKSIIDETDFVTAAQHPQKYFFAKVDANQFMLIQENGSFICKTESPILDEASIEIMSKIPDLGDSKIIYYSRHQEKKERPQTKNPTVPVLNGYLPAHKSNESAVLIANHIQNKKNFAQCQKNFSPELAEKKLLELAQTEIEDLFADFAEFRDALAYNYDIKDSKVKQNIRTQFDLKLKKILEICASVPELRSVTQRTLDSVKSKISVSITLPGGSSPTSTGKSKLPARTNQ